MTEIKKLLHKYYKQEGKNMTAHTKINKAEKITNNYNKKMKQEQYRKNRHLILDTLLTEIPFTLTQTQTTQIRYWIDQFNNEFKSFHRNSSNETILLAFIMIQRKKTNPQSRVDKFTISKKYNLNNATFELIQNRLIFQLMKTTPLTYAQSEYYNHEILIKKGY